MIAFDRKRVVRDHHGPIVWHKLILVRYHKHALSGSKLSYYISPSTIRSLLPISYIGGTPFQLFEAIGHTKGWYSMEISQ